MGLLKNFELVPEAYRQKFRDKKKEDEQSYVEFQIDKEGLLDMWYSAKEVGGDIEKFKATNQ